jgi:hypothetical protein
VRCSSTDQDDNHPFRFEIRNPDDQAVITVETIVGETYTSWEKEVAGLYDAVRNAALGIDSVVRGLEKDLGLADVGDPEEDIPF